MCLEEADWLENGVFMVWGSGMVVCEYEKERRFIIQ